jgi:hypothetical protein
MGLASMSCPTTLPAGGGVSGHGVTPYGVQTCTTPGTCAFWVRGGGCFLLFFAAERPCGAATPDVFAWGWPPCHARQHCPREVGCPDTGWSPTGSEHVPPLGLVWILGEGRSVFFWSGPAGPPPWHQQGFECVYPPNQGRRTGWRHWFGWVATA